MVHTDGMGCDGIGTEASGNVTGMGTGMEMDVIGMEQAGMGTTCGEMGCSWNVRVGWHGSGMEHDGNVMVEMESDMMRLE